MASLIELQSVSEPKVVFKTNLELLQEKVDTDVTFVVGTEKEIIKCHQRFLADCSPVFQVMFADRWVGSEENDKCEENEKSELKLDKNEIELPDIDPFAFHKFLQFAYTKQISFDAYYPTISEVEKIVYVADKYDVLSLQRKCENILESIMDERKPRDGSVVFQICQLSEKYNLKATWNAAVSILARDLRDFKDEKEFLQLSQATITSILSNEDIPMNEFKIFEAVNRWAVYQCEDMEIETNGENLRAVLGSALFEVRFPTMASYNFKIIREKNILTDEECLVIANLRSLSEAQKNNYDSNDVVFKTRQRQVFIPKPPKFAFRGPTLDLTSDFKFDNKHFECVGDWNEVFFKTKQRILLHGLCFFGPKWEDSVYDLRIQINGRNILEERVLVKLGDKFRIIFEDPVLIKGISDRGWADRNVIRFSLKGPPTHSVIRKRREKAEFFHSDVDFYFKFFSQQLSKLLFTKAPAKQRKRRY